MIGDKFIFIDVNSIPDKLDENVVYNCYSDRRIDLICHCGCGAVISLNTLLDASPKWNIVDNTIHPSISRIYGCRSHFSIKNGIVE